jgi:hypothetical protein
VTLFGGAGGMAMGGYLIKRFKLRLLGIMKLILFNLVLASACGCIAFQFNCEEGKRAGLNFHYGPVTE